MHKIRELTFISYQKIKIMVPIISRKPDMTDSCKQMLQKSTNSLVSSPSLKRKRPPKIEIPMILREIVVADTEIKSRDDAGAGEVCFSGFGVGVVSVKGKKSFMEDTHKIVFPSNGNKGYFGVFDGHGGSKAAQFVADNLHSNVFEMLEKCSENTTKEEAIKAGFLKTDDDFLKQGLRSGACCVMALIEGNELVISNIGDCRAVLSIGGKAEALTVDHRAANEDERKRIENKGGYVVNHRGTWRVHGILAVSRSIGDAHLKEWVVAEPETKIIQLTKDMDYIVLASDGLWEEKWEHHSWTNQNGKQEDYSGTEGVPYSKVSNQEAIDIIMQSCAAEKRLGENASKANNVECDSVMSSPKLPRVLQGKPKKRNAQSLCYTKRVDRWKDNFASENESPTSKSRKTSSMENQMKTRIQTSSDQENSGNEMPPIKTRKILMANESKKRVQISDQETTNGKKTASSDQLTTACQELVNLAVKKGSLDDITVMIIDLNKFKY